MPNANQKETINHFLMPELDGLHIRGKILAIQEKAGFVPNVFLTLAHRPEKFRAFFAYYDALMEKEGGSPRRSGK